MKGFEPKDYIAVIVVVGGLILLGLGRNGTVSSILLAVVSFYFGYSAAINKVKRG